jgi:hypothetical protein
MRLIAGPTAASLSDLARRIDLHGVTTTAVASLVALVVVVAILEALGARGEASGARRLARAAVRSLVLAIVAAALVGPSLTSQAQAPRRLVLLVDDHSRATAGGRAAADDLVRLARESCVKSGASLVVVPFGATPRRDPDVTPLAPTEGPLEPTIEGASSRLAPALAAAALAIPRGSAAATIVATDGHAALDGAKEAVAGLSAEGVPVRWVAIPPPPPLAAPP